MSNYLDTIKEAVIKKLVEKATDSILEFFKNKEKKNGKDNKTIKFDEKIITHFNELYNWCKELEFIGLGGMPISTNTKTIKLQYQFSRSRFHSDEILKDQIGEDSIVSSQGNILIEGDPGSGKTTTLKRVLYNYFFSSTCLKSSYTYPILIRLRSIELGYNLYTHIAALIGINYETIIEKYQVEVERSRIIKVNGIEKEEKYKKSETRERNLFFIEGVKIDNALIELFEKHNVLLIMDGFDELKPELFEIIQEQIRNLGVKLFNAKIIITTRPNYLKVVLPNFSVYQVNPLTAKQMGLISQLWLTDHSNFIKELKYKSYYELANRPLFFSFLILLYKEYKGQNKNKLPKFSRDVYDQIIELLLVKWDKEKGLKRASEYSEFDAQKKLLFLSHLSFRLTYVIKEKIFTRAHLIKAYSQIYPIFDLPASEAELVAEELEKHTGIIVKSLYDKYEFSHLAIQEYLCAVCIIRAPFSDAIKNYILEYPTPLAIAVALSTNSSMWLSELLLKLVETVTTESSLTQIAIQILHRITIETPYFEVNRGLAVSIMNLCKRCNTSNLDFKNCFERIVSSNKNIEISILELLTDYDMVKSSSFPTKASFQKKDTSVDNNYQRILCLPPKTYLLDLIK